MRIQLYKNDNFERYAEVAPVPAPAGLFSVRFSSIWRESKEPDYERENFVCITDREGLNHLYLMVAQVLDGRMT